MMVLSGCYYLMPYAKYVPRMCFSQVLDLQLNSPINRVSVRGRLMKMRRPCRVFGSLADLQARSPTPFPGWNADSCVMLNFTVLCIAPHD